MFLLNLTADMSIPTILTKHSDGVQSGNKRHKYQKQKNETAWE